MGWTFEEFKLPSGSYWLIKSGDRLVGGIGGVEIASLPGKDSSHWFSFVEVDKADTRIEKAIQEGSTILTVPEDVLNVGRVAVFRDPTGAAIG